MPIDMNLANWNKENENSTPIRVLPPRIQGATSASTGARLTLKSRRPPFAQLANYSALAAMHQNSRPLPSTGTPKCRRFLKRADLVTEEARWVKIRQVFPAEDNVLSAANDDQSMINELLTLCSWWSETENFAKGGFQSDDASDSNGENSSGAFSDSDDGDNDFIFSGFASYLASKAPHDNSVPGAAAVSSTPLRAANRGSDETPVRKRASSRMYASKQDSFFDDDFLNFGENYNGAQKSNDSSHSSMCTRPGAMHLVEKASNSEFDLNASF